MRKKILIFSKMAPTILIKFSGFIVHSKTSNMPLSALPGKIPETGKMYLKFFFRLLTQGLNQSTDLVQIRYLRSSSKYLEPLFLVFALTLKLRVVHIRKKFKISIFSKMVPTILIKFYAFIVHSKPNNMTLSAFPGKIPETGKIYLKFFFRLLTQGLHQLIILVQNRYLGSSRKYLFF